ncbi:MAG: acetyl/propionyl/methylcrotonyl-CoA carboxylase subunit alpha [Candidatus Binatia bacterium]
MTISRVLVANRGEIGVRIIKACQALGIESVVAVSEADRESLPSKMASRVVCIGPASSSDSYLKAEAVIAAALGTGSDAIHPGYGFLAEEPELAAGCAECGVKFIGPRVENIRQMGNKLLARAVVSGYGIPIVPGSRKVGSFQEASVVAGEMGFPVLLKAAAGGGGRGIQIVKDGRELQRAFETAAAEARAAFGDETLYVERYIPNARHIEVQVLGDRFGSVLHVGERDCSLQRRYQKVVEEAPASCISDHLREEIREAALTIAREMHYENAGTVEFIVDQDNGRFYFLEMNTRIQVEHPVTEMITDIDLVKEQIRIADGQPLAFHQSDVRFHGHAVECRINAESARHGFQPCPGSIVEWSPPEGPGVRVDSHCFPGYFVPPYYDSLLAKVITQGAERHEAVERMLQALANFVVTGVDTTIPFLRFLLSQPGYREGKVNTQWVEGKLEQFSL